VVSLTQVNLSNIQPTLSSATGTVGTTTVSFVGGEYITAANGNMTIKPATGGLNQLTITTPGFTSGISNSMRSSWVMAMEPTQRSTSPSTLTMLVA
jgi:hypothetical protein